MEEFYEPICKKAEKGIPYAEAVQFMVWMFLTLGFIPEQFHKLELSKVNLAILFARLGKNGKIIIGQSDHLQVMGISRPAHGEAIVSQFLLKKLTLDETF